MWKCEHCKEEHEEGFDSCWKCQSFRHPFLEKEFSRLEKLESLIKTSNHAINFYEDIKKNKNDLESKDWDFKIKRIKHNLKNSLLKVSNIPGDLQYTYFKKTTNIESEYYVFNGKRNGPMRVYYESGQLRTEINFNDDLPDGIAKDFFENGKIQTINHFKKGKENGKFISYHTNGNIHTKYNFVDGFQHGKQENWFLSGTIDVEKNMKDGKRHGWSRNYFNNGKIEFEGKYAEGEPIGSHKTWGEEGTLIDETYY